MNIRRLYHLTGYISVIVGISAMLCMFRIQWIYYGVALAILGFITSITNIFLNSKYEFDEEKFPKGYIGMFLSSLPVIFMMLIIFRFRK